MENFTCTIPTAFFEEEEMMRHQRQTKKNLKNIRRSRPDCFTVEPEFLKKNQHQLETSSSSSDSEEEFTVPEHLKRTPRFIKRQDVRRIRPDCFTVVPEYLKKKLHQLESSSSSSSDSEEEFTLAKHLKRTPRFIKRQDVRRVRPDCFTVVPEFLKKTLHQLESSSSSDSEDEFNTYPRNTIPKYMKWSQQQQQMDQQTRKWFTLVDLEGFRPQEVTAKVNAKCRILVIKAKNTGISHLNQQQRQMELQQEEMTGGKVIRVIPLPDNIRLEKLRVQVLPREGRLLVKAPFTIRGEEGVQQQGRFLPTWIPIRVTLKHQEEDDFYTNKRFNRYQQQQQQHHQGNFPTGFPFSQMEEDILPNKWWKQMQQRGEQTSTISNSLPLMKITEIIRDETTGKPVMLVKVNTLGFRPEEIRVRVDETKRVLIVEATKRNIRQHQMQMQMDEGLTMKYLRREFVLPQWLDVSRMSFHVVKCGLLIVKLPIVKQNEMFHNINCSTRCGCDRRDEIFGAENVKIQKQQHKKDWERRLRA